MNPNRLFDNGAVQHWRIDQAQSFAHFSERGRGHRSFSGECRSLTAMMPLNRMIEFRSFGVFVPFLFDIEVCVQLAAFFGCVSMEEWLVHQPCQQAGDAISHGCSAAHAKHCDGQRLSKSTPATLKKTSESPVL